MWTLILVIIYYLWLFATWLMFLTNAESYYEFYYIQYWKGYKGSMSFKRTKMGKFMDFIWIFGTFISIVVFCGGGFNWLLYPGLKFFEHDNDAIFSFVLVVGLIFAYHIMIHIIPKLVIWQRFKKMSNNEILDEIKNAHWPKNPSDFFDVQ